jgi:hypothetical protein
MALYRFRITFEDYDDVTREIDIKSNQYFEDLHNAIHQSTGYNPEFSSSFYISNDQWIKGEEITYLPNQKRIDRGVSLMNKVKLSSFIDDTPGVVYPKVIKSVGDAPRQIIPGVIPADLPIAVSDDFDFLNEMAFNPEDTEDFSEVTDTGEEGQEEKTDDSEAEEDEFGSGFSDDEGFEDHDKSHDDY